MDEHPLGYHFCEREHRAMKRAVDAENQRAKAWHDRQAALLLLRDKGVEIGDESLSAMGAELARDRQRGHDAWESGSRYRRTVVATLFETEDLLDKGADPRDLLPALLRSLHKVSERHKA